MPSELTDDFDTLREEFVRLEREVAQREGREFRARCPHPAAIALLTFGSQARKLVCQSCGATVEDTTP